MTTSNHPTLQRAALDVVCDARPMGHADHAVHNAQLDALRHAIDEDGALSSPRQREIIAALQTFHRARNEGGPAYQDALRALGHLFPTLRRADGIEPWDPMALDAWATSGVCSGAVHAARFVLHVWNSTADWQAGRFDLFRALATWDTHHRQALATFLRCPFHP